MDNYNHSIQFALYSLILFHDSLIVLVTNLILFLSTLYMGIVTLHQYYNQQGGLMIEYHHTEWSIHLMFTNMYSDQLATDIRIMCISPLFFFFVFLWNQGLNSWPNKGSVYFIANCYHLTLIVCGIVNNF